MGNFIFCSTKISCTFIVQIWKRKRLGVLSVLKDEGIVASAIMKHYAKYHTAHLWLHYSQLTSFNWIKTQR